MEDPDSILAGAAANFSLRILQRRLKPCDYLNQLSESLSLGSVAVQKTRIGKLKMYAKKRKSGEPKSIIPTSQ